VNHTVTIEEIRQQAAIQIVKVEEAAQAKYDAAINDVRREIAEQVAETETAALRKYNEAVENVQREAADRIARAEEKATKATDRAEAAATDAADMYNKVQELMKQLLGATARAEVLEKSAAAATFRAEEAEEEVKQMKRRLETTRTGMGSELFGWPIQEEEGRDWAMGETMEYEQRRDALGTSRAVRNEVLAGKLPQETAIQTIQNAHRIIDLESGSAGTPANEVIDLLKPVSSEHVHQLYTSVEPQCQTSDTDMLDPELDIYAPGDSSDNQGGLSGAKRVISIVRSSEGKEVEEKGKGRLITDAPEVGANVQNAEYHDKGMGDSPPESSVKTPHKSTKSAASRNNRRVQNESKRTTTPIPARHSRPPEVKAAQQHDWVSHVAERIQAFISYTNRCHLLRNFHDRNLVEVRESRSVCPSTLLRKVNRNHKGKRTVRRK
jgi:hypothetical protein